MRLILEQIPPGRYLGVGFQYNECYWLHIRVRLFSESIYRLVNTVRK
jgi:hypothetical protein